MKDITTTSGNAIQQSAMRELEIQAERAIKFPRDEAEKEKRILKACKRLSLAVNAQYSYKRGRELVEGPSIKLLEEIARHWSNLAFGVREIGQQNGYTEVQAFAIDLETNTWRTMNFNVKHWRDTRAGGYELTQARDIYEAVGNIASRRLRRCLESIIPPDVIEAAQNACLETLKEAVGDKPDMMGKVLTALEKHSVTKAQVEKHLGHSADSASYAEIIRLGKMCNAIRDGYADAKEQFPQDVAGRIASKAQS